MRILSREHFKQGIFSKTVLHCGLMFSGIVILQAWPNEGISQSNTTVLHPYEPVGCFKDSGRRRAFPTLVNKYPDMINDSDLANSFAAIILTCANEVYKRGFWYFGVEYRHQCWSGVNGSMTYNRNGPSDECLFNHSVGTSWSIYVYRFVKVNGSWSQWSSWQPCSVTCGGGNRTRARTCSNPAPKWNGMDCLGTNISTESCNLSKCKGNGSWNQWSPWQPCSVTCGGGNRTRARTCSNPAPKWNEMDCPGTNISTESCNMHKCKDTTVLHPYKPVGCFEDKRHRRAFPTLVNKYPDMINDSDLANSFEALIPTCANEVYKRGFWYFGVEYHHECWSGVDGRMTYNRNGPSDECLFDHSVGASWSIYVYRFVEVNGSWSQWSSWQPCSVTCGGGNRTRARTCSNPAPKWNGIDCPGTNISTEICNLLKCKDSIGGNLLHSNNTGESSLPLVAKILCSSILVLLCLSGVLWYAIRYRRKRSRSNSELFDPWEIRFDDVSLHNIIGEGAFGKVYKGEFLKKLTEVGKERRSSRRKTIKKQHQMKKGLIVAVKMLQNGATEEQKQEFLEEIQLMKQIGYHPNILNLLACCTLTNPRFLVVEFAENGDLLHHLKKRREQIKQAFEATGEAAPNHSRYQTKGVINEGSLYECTIENNSCAAIAYESIKNNTDNLHDDDTLTPADLMTFAWQIAKGMEFLSRKGFVHRDLAARNVLVCEGKLVKVADFGLSRNVYARRVYHAKKTRKLPIKWMSPEAIHDQVFTAESDVWAYGILLWEIFTIGGTPYPTISNHKLFGALKSGYRMDKPQMCSDEMYELMRQCWKGKPTERPSFTVIREQLERMMLHHCPYLDMADAKYSYSPCYDVDSDKETETESTL